MKDIRDQIIEKQEEMIIALSTESINKERFDKIVGLGKDINSLKSQLSEQKDEPKDGIKDSQNTEQQLNLPSDEEIENMAKNYPHNYYRNSHDFVLGLTLGAKWMREEIKKSNKNV